jgi:hypothetical protein
MSADVSEEIATLAENASIAATNAARRAREAAGTARELATELRARREAEAHEASAGRRREAAGRDAFHRCDQEARIGRTDWS